ncbi:hypothetical protein OHR68_14085 [Spirillospora sp. NBC_00431]
MILVDPLQDTTDRISWGWTALLYDIDHSQWVPSQEASKFSGLSPTALKRWAGRGVLSQVTSRKGRGRFYLRSELDVIWCITHNTTSQDGAPSLRVIRAHIEDVIYNGFR